jgi:ABC-type multidrug transport system fused ATPase/permease subunit
MNLVRRGDLVRSAQLANSGGKIPTEECRGEIRFSDVYFAYPTRETAGVLQGLTLHVAENTTTALVGSSGCGKSTVLSLLLRFYQPSRGTITLDGNDVSILDPRWLRGRMAFVQQEPVLFGRSLNENITYGLAAQGANATATATAIMSISGSTDVVVAKECVVSAVVDHSMPDEATQQRIEAACKLASAHDFISGFEEGYSTLIGERGVRLSGGQKQRIAIARALLTEPRLLLLDEATSALDSESEALVQDAIERASTGRTVIVVAHRLSTVRDAHQIALLGKGRVIDAGSHEEMIQRCEPYLALVKRQLQGAGSPAASPNASGMNLSKLDVESTPLSVSPTTL